MSDEIKRQLYEEGLDTMRTFSSNILSLEKGYNQREGIAEILRALHSLKGSLRMLGYPEIGSILHETEDIVDLINRHPEICSDDIIDMLLYVSDQLQEAFAEIHREMTPQSMDHLLAGLKTVQSVLGRELDNQIDHLSRFAPEIFNCINAQQKEILVRNLAVYNYLLLLELSFQRDHYSNSVRSVQDILSEVGLPICATSTTTSPDEGYDLKFLFLAFSNLDPGEVCARLFEYAPHCTQLPKAPFTHQDFRHDNNGIIDSSAVAANPNLSNESPFLDPSYLEEFRRLQSWFLDEGEESLKSLNSEIILLESSPQSDTYNSIARTFHNLKGSGGSYKFPHISRLAHILESFVHPWRNYNTKISGETVTRLLKGVDILDRTFRKCKQGDHDLIPIEEYERELTNILHPPSMDQASTKLAQGGDLFTIRQTSIRSPESVRINLKKLDSIVNNAIELTIAHHAEDDLFTNISDLIETQQHLGTIWEKVKGVLRKEKISENSRLWKMVEEYSDCIVSVKDKLCALETKIEMNCFIWKKLANSVGEEVLQLQLQPITTLFDIFERIVRDLSLSLGKEIELEIRGDNIEIDRRIIEELKDPFVHLLRNAIDHGIEDPDHREKAGKSRQGRILIETQHMDFSFSVTFTDDGRGLDREEIAKIILERKLATSEQILAFSDPEIFRFLFKSGFSTRRNVTDISGRGIGLDVVSTNVKKLGGEIFLSSEANKGTVFRFILPTTLSISRVLILRIGEQYFSIPVSSTEQIIPLSPDDAQDIYGEKKIRFRDVLIPIIELEGVLRLQKSQQLMRNGLILRKDDSYVCLSAPIIVDETGLMTKPLPIYLRNNKFVSGANILPDGSISLLLDSQAIIREKSVDLSAKKDERSRRKKRILIIDGSIISGEVLKNVLIISGYDAVLVGNGEEGLQYLRGNSVDLILADLDMQIMDGFSFTRSVKTEKMLNQIPVVIVATKETENERRQSESAGADAYVLKGSFNQNNLLSVIERLIVRSSFQEKGAS